MGQGTAARGAGLMALTLDVRAEQLTTMMSFLQPKTFQKAVRAGGRRAGSTARTQAGKEIRARYNLPSTRIKADITVGRATPDGISLVFKRRPAPTIRAYGARFSGGTSSASRGTTTWSVFRQGGKTASRNVFWRRSKSGRILPFVSSSSGLPGPFFPKGAKHGIRVMYGPTVGSIFARDSRYGDEIRSAVNDATLGAFVKGVDRELGRLGRGF